MRKPKYKIGDVVIYCGDQIKLTGAVFNKERNTWIYTVDKYPVSNIAEEHLDLIENLPECDICNDTGEMDVDETDESGNVFMFDINNDDLKPNEEGKIPSPFIKKKN